MTALAGVAFVALLAHLAWRRRSPLPVVDYEAEAEDVIRRYEHSVATAPESLRRIREAHPIGPRGFRAVLDPNVYTPADVAAIEALLPEHLGVELGDPAHYEPGYCHCCGGPCRDES